VGGSSRRRRRRSRWLLGAVVAVAIVLVTGAGAGAWVGYGALKTDSDRLQSQVTADIQAGQRELEAGKASLAQANEKHDPALAAQALESFAAAKTHFQAAANRADTSTLLRYVEQIPSAGAETRAKHVAVDLIADMGVQLSDAGLQLATLDQRLISPPSAGPAGHTLLTVLSDTSDSLTNVRSDLVQAQADASRLDVSQLPESQRSAFAKVKSTIDDGLAGVDEFKRLVPVLTDVLGGNGPRTYLVEQLNPAELRAGGGFIGSYSIVRANQGMISIVRSGDAYALANPRPLPGQPGFIPQPTPLREIIPDVSWSFVDSNVYPDFPSNAKAALQFVEPRVGKLDGVIAFDYFMVAKMLELTGPMQLPGYGITVNASNLISQLIKIDIAGTTYHKTILSAMAGPLMARISALSPDRWPTLLGDFNALGSQRHLQVYLVNLAAEKEIDRYGWSGALNPTNSSEFFMELEDNYWGNKVNYYLTRHFTITLTLSGNVLHHKIAVDLVNRTPGNSYPRVDYRSVLRLYAGMPNSGGVTNVYPARYPAPAPPSGFRMLYGWLDVACCGGQRVGTFSYDTPWTPSADGTTTLYWQKQPGTSTDAVDIVWHDGSQTHRLHGSFNQDTAVVLSTTGVTLTAGHPAQAILPNLSLG
jgi:hypothetical protein